MLGVLLLLFIALPVAEIALLVKIGQAIDFGPTVALVIATGVVGAALAKHQGLRTLARIQENLARGAMPGREMVDGVLILLAGAVLITPGVITDAMGLLLLIPPTRALVRKAAVAYFSKRMTVVTPPQDQPFSSGTGFVDVEATEVNERPPDNSSDN